MVVISSPIVQGSACRMIVGDARRVIGDRVAEIEMRDIVDVGEILPASSGRSRPNFGVIGPTSDWMSTVVPPYSICASIFSSIGLRGARRGTKKFSVLATQIDRDEHQQAARQRSQGGMRAGAHRR